MERPTERERERTYEPTAAGLGAGAAGPTAAGLGAAGAPSAGLTREQEPLYQRTAGGGALYAPEEKMREAGAAKEPGFKVR